MLVISWYHEQQEFLGFLSYLSCMPSSWKVKGVRASKTRDTARIFRNGYYWGIRLCRDADANELSGTSRTWGNRVYGLSLHCTGGGDWLLICSHNVGLNMAVTIITSVFTQSWACCVLLLPNIQPNNSVDHSSHSSGNFRF